MSLKILDLLRKYGATLELTGDKYKTNCIFPDHLDENPSFVVYPATNSFYCFSCSRGGGPISLVMYREGVSRDEAIKVLELDNPVAEIERLLQPEEPIDVDFNVETNFVISNMIRTKLQAGSKWEQVAPFLQKLDMRLTTEKLTEVQAKELITETQHL